MRKRLPGDELPATGNLLKSFLSVNRYNFEITVVLHYCLAGIFVVETCENFYTRRNNC